MEQAPRTYERKYLCYVYKCASGVPQRGMMRDVCCHSVRLGKAHMFHLKRELKCSSHIGEVVHSDIVDPLESSYPYGYRYFATFQDVHYLYGFARMMRNKSDIREIFIACLLRLSAKGSNTTQ